MVERLFGEVDNLECFVHPEFRRAFRLASDERLFTYAETIAQKIRESQCGLVVVAETGAVPFAKLCEWILRRDGGNVQWKYIKFPRDPLKNIAEIIKFQLTDEERSRTQGIEAINEQITKRLFEPEENLQDILKQIEKPIDGKPYEEMRAVLEGTRISALLSQPFIYFDEYVDSGTTLWSAYHYFNLFALAKFKIMSFYINIEDGNSHPAVCCSLFDAATRKQCFEGGVYPFENRIDLIGHWYHIDEGVYEKMTLDQLREEFPSAEIGASGFLKTLRTAVCEPVLEVQRAARIRPVASYISEDDGVRYLLTLLEQGSGHKKICHEFLWQVFEMYGPIWSPLPDEYHLDFLQAFMQNERKFRAIEADIRSGYLQFRSSIFAVAAQEFTKRRDDWLHRMDLQLEKNA